MYIRTTGILFLFLALCWCAESQVSHTVPLRLERNRALIDVHIENTLLPRVLLDTGFSFDGLLIYNPAYQDSLDLSDARTVRIRGAGSGEGTSALMIEAASFELGGIMMVNQRVILLRDDTYKDFPSNGIIGYSVFGRYVTEFNYDTETMILHDPGFKDPDRSWTPIPIYFKDNNIPWLTVSLVVEDEESVSLSAYIDFAAGDAIILLEKPDMKFGLPKDTVDYYIGRGLSGDIHGKKGSVSRLTLGPFELQNVTASVASARVRSKQDDADAIIGHDLLQRFNLIFDYENKMLYLKPNRRFREPFE